MLPTNCTLISSSSGVCFLMLLQPISRRIWSYAPVYPDREGPSLSGARRTTSALTTLLIDVDIRYCTLFEETFCIAQQRIPGLNS